MTESTTVTKADGAAEATTAQVDDTIAAIATAAGRGGVGILRLSGPSALKIGLALSARSALTPRYAHRVRLHDSTNKPVDDGLVLFFPGPNSFTGEDVVELHSHGSPVVLDILQQAACNLGARMAEPGEFSQRAFLNDKMDLAQAEAIADLINSATEQAARNAARSMSGEFSRRIQTLVTDVTGLRIYVEAAIDFPEEEVDFLSEGKVDEQLQSLQDRLSEVRDSARQGSLLREGMKLVIAGRPNAGKSSLLNALAGKERAIVTPIAGTTRDILREDIQIDGLPLHIVDTAGLRHSNDPVEQEGVRRAAAEISSADRIILLVDDASDEDPPVLRDLLPEDVSPPPSSTPVTLVHNKIDISGSGPRLETSSSGNAELWLSAQTGYGLDLLKQHLKDSIGLQASGETHFSARRRHLQSLAMASEHLEMAVDQLRSGGGGELVAEELRYCQNSLGEITGKVSSDELLGKIFTSFCIGK